MDLNIYDVIACHMLAREKKKDRCWLIVVNLSKAIRFEIFFSFSQSIFIIGSDFVTLGFFLSKEYKN